MIAAHFTLDIPIMRKLIPCLLIAGTVVVSGCNQQGPAGSGPGVIAADDPLNYVPSDTPYVMANIDPIPADVTSAWIDRIDKAGKVGDLYADQIEAAEKLTRDAGADCSPTAPAAAPAAAASGGGGGAMQDPASDAASPADPASASASASDAGDASAPSDASSPNLTAPAADASAPPSSEDKCSPASVADRDKTLKLMEAFKAEVAGKDAKGLIDLIGAVPQTHFAFYGIGIVPVFRVELAKPDNLRATIGRIETQSGSKLGTGKVGGLDYWIVGGENPEGKINLVFAISGKQLVATIAPAKASEADLRTLFGLDKPKKSLADSGDLTTLNKKMNYLSYGSGYFDSAKLVAELKAPPTPLETSFLTATGQHKPAVDAVCSAEYDQIAAAWPGASFGYSELSLQHMSLRAVLETRADIATDLKTLRAPMPGLAAAQDALADFGFSANLAKLPDVASKYADAAAKSPWKCESLAGLNTSMAQSKTTLTNPGFAGYAPMFHGFHAIVDKLDMKDGQPIPDVAGVVAIGSDNPAGLLGLASSLPGMADLGLKPDGVAKPLPPMPNLPINAPMFAAMTDKVLGVSIGTGEDAKLAAAMKSDDTQQPLLEFGAKGDIYHTFAQFQRKAAQSLGDPNAQKMMEEQAKMMDMYADWFKHVDLRIELTDAGIELHESVDMK